MIPMLGGSLYFIKPFGLENPKDKVHDDFKYIYIYILKHLVYVYVFFPKHIKFSWVLRFKCFLLKVAVKV
jgi:hypothetical protein